MSDVVPQTLMTPSAAPPTIGAAARPRTALRVAATWAGGFVVATLLVWPVTGMLLDSECKLAYDAAVGDYVFAAGQQYRQRSEGWASTHIGKHGVLGTDDISAVREPIVAFWGDSYVEALQVDDEQKMTAQFTRLWRAAGGPPRRAADIGFSGRGAADYWHFMPVYERIAPAIACHVIVLGQLSDILPDVGEGRSATFVSRPAPAIKPIAHAPRKQEIKGLLDEMNLQLAWRLGNDLANCRLRLAMGEVAAGSPPAQAANAEPDAATLAAWSWLLDAFRSRTRLPVLFVYVPTVPCLQDGRVCSVDPQARLLGRFGELCRARGLGFIDMGDDFRRFHAQTGRLPRGFDNTVPGQGHLNADGHRLVAEAVCRTMRSN